LQRVIPAWPAADLGIDLRTSSPIAGLYAARTDMASVIGGHYPAGGINLGPAMTFGYIAGRHAAGVTAYEDARRTGRPEVHA
jgi:succinate dehydrogenase/fumarate reductase flavoprotein subunit